MARSSKTLKSGLHTLLWKEGKWYVAKCLEVEVASQGRTKPEAISNLEEALELYFENEKAPFPQGLENPQVHNLKIGYA